MTRWQKYWEREEAWERLVGVVLFMPMTFSALCGIVVLGIQGLGWLKLGTWTDMTIQDAIGYPIFSETTGWVGLDRILQWVDTAPLWAWFVVILPGVWLPIGVLVCWHLEGWINPTQENLAGRIWVAGLGLVGAFIGGLFLIGWLRS
jgi:hypothetical protein